MNITKSVRLKYIIIGIILVIFCLGIIDFIYGLGHYESGELNQLSELPYCGKEFIDLKTLPGVHYKIFHTIHARSTFLVSGRFLSSKEFMDLCEKNDFTIYRYYKDNAFFERACDGMKVDRKHFFTQFSDSDMVIVGRSKNIPSFSIGFRPKDGMFTMVFQGTR